MSSIDEIKARIDIVDLVSETVKLRRSGKNYTGFCPFHSNTRTPAFVVFPESGTWRCFGQCNEGGDIFGYMMKREGWDFAEALRRLAERAGVELKPQTPQQQAIIEEHDSLRALLEEALTFFHHNLNNTPAGKVALEYLYKRGLKPATIEAFGLGYAPLSWDAALAHFKSKGCSDKDLVEAGLVSERDPERLTGAEGEKKIFDRFRNRIMFPIRDERGRMAGFGARILDPNDVPKFLNSPQTPVFEKGQLLYGLDRARKAIRLKEHVVIVEGYLDVIALHQAGFENVVSPMGTALTEHQLYLLKRFTRQVILALDPDAAGDKATLRGLEIARQAMDRQDELVFDARGLLRHEARLQADIRVCSLPAGLDPDEVVNRDPAEWERIIATARPIVIHVMETLAAGHDLDDPKVKTLIAGQVLPLIEDVASPVERDTYLQRLARLLKVDERTITLQPSTRTTRPGRRKPPPAGGPPATQGRVTSLGANPTQLLEAHYIGLLMRRPDLLYKMDRQLQQSGLMRVSVVDFQRTDNQTFFRLIQESLDQDGAEPLNYVLNRLSLPLMDVADDLLAPTARIDIGKDDVLEDLMRTLLELRLRALRQNIDHLRYLMEEAQQQGDGQVTEYRQMMVQYIQNRDRLDKAQGLYTSRIATSRS